MTQTYEINLWDNKKVIRKVVQQFENDKEVLHYIKKEFDTQKFSEFKDQFQWFILIGFVLIVIDIFMRDGKTIWLKNLNLFNEK